MNKYKFTKKNIEKLKLFLKEVKKNDAKASNKTTKDNRIKSQTR